MKRLKKIKPDIISSYKSLNTIFVYEEKIKHNLEYLQSLKPEDTIIPVLKSNAYGHGLKQVCQILSNTDNAQYPLLAVDSFPEYQIVRDETKKDILILGETRPENYSLYDPNRSHLCIGSLRTLKAIIESGLPYKVHLFINTGMNREGFQEKELEQALDLLKESHLHVIGVISHFANADHKDASFNHQQIAQYKKMYQTISSFGHYPIYKQIANSAGIAKVEDPFFNTRRTGIAFYGYSPCEETDKYAHLFEPLQPALEIQTTITSCQKIYPGEGVNYGLQRKNESNMILTTATIPFGYHEGLPRSLQSGFLFSLQGINIETSVELVGAICMNLSSVLIPPKYEKAIKQGDSLQIVSTDKNASNTIEKISRKSGKIPYEVLVGLDKGLKRVVL